MRYHDELSVLKFVLICIMKRKVNINASAIRIDPCDELHVLQDRHWKSLNFHWKIKDS